MRHPADRITTTERRALVDYSVAFDDQQCGEEHDGAPPRYRIEAKGAPRRSVRRTCCCQAKGQAPECHDSWEPCPVLPRG